MQLINKESGEIKEQDVFLGPVPLMTTSGSFIVNGIERCCFKLFVLLGFSPRILLHLECTVLKSFQTWAWL